MQSIQSQLPHWQEPSPADCRHSHEAFDVGFAAVKDKPGLTIADRVVHAAMVSLHRLGRLGTVTQEQIAEWARVSRRTVVRSCQALMAAGLLLSRRRGQGRPNAYQLVGIDQDALDGRSDKRTQPKASEGRTGDGVSFNKKNNGRKSGYTPPKASDYARAPEGGSYMLRDGRMVLVPS
jgi:hypothetical protein